MHYLYPLLLNGLLLIQTVCGSPFELTDNYVNDFAEGIEKLKKDASETQFKEGAFDATKYNEDEALKDASEYDFIVVGSGASGSVIANRLSEIPEWKVLLLEAGAPETPYTQVPSLSHLLQGTKYNWGYTTEPQETWCLGMIDKKCTCATGKAVGGSTVINSMIYTRGNPKDYDLWADKGNAGWCYGDVLPYFKKSENAHLSHFDRKFHNQGGPLQVEDPQHVTELADVFLEAGKELGIKTVDYNGKEQLGFSKAQATTKYGKRNSAAQAYLTPIKDRKNLEVKPLSHVIEIIINPHTKETSGVKYIHEDKMYIAKADKEVILSAGALNSPQLLMLSGVGPKDELEKLNISLVYNLPVGKHMKDHIDFLGLNFLLNESKVEEHKTHDNLVTWLREGKGPLSAISIEGLGYIKTKASKDKSDYPDVELIFSPKTHYSGATENGNLRIKKEVYETMWKPLEGHKTFSISVMPTHPKSVGSLTLKSKDPFHWPVLHPNQLSDPDDHDIETMLAGIKKAIAISETGPFQELGAHLHEEPVAGCEQHDFGTDPYWKCAARHLSISLRHQTGTCRMGPETDKDAVVDHELRVYGIDKLRVADASVIPISITGHLHAPSVMVGEKAADLIKNHWK